MIAQGTQTVLLFPFRAEGYSETRQHVTEVFRTSNGKEFRRSLSVDYTPVRAVSADWSSMDVQEANYVRNIIQNGLDTTVLVPLWLSATRLDSPIVSGTTITCDTTGREFATVSKALVVDVAYQSPVVSDIVTVGASSLELDDAVGPYAAGAWVVPVITATPMTNDSRASLDNRSTGTVEFLELTGWKDYTPDISALSTFGGYPVFDPDPMGEQRLSIVNEFEMVGESWQQRTKVVNEVSELRVERSHLLRTVAARNAFRAFFDSRLGKVNPFWIVERRASFRLYAGATAGASSIQVYPYANTVNVDALLKRYVRSRETGDTYLLSNPVAGSTYNTFDVSPVIAADIPAGDYMDALLFVRFDADSLTLQHGVREPLSEVSCAFREVQRETP